MDTCQELFQHVSDRDLAVKRVDDFVKANLDELVKRRVVKVTIDYRNLADRTGNRHNSRRRYAEEDVMAMVDRNR
jgi:hypothetical protein